MAKNEGKTEVKNQENEQEEKSPQNIEKNKNENENIFEKLNQCGDLPNADTNKTSYKKFSGEQCMVQKPDGEWREYYHHPNLYRVFTAKKYKFVQKPYTCNNSYAFEKYFYASNTNMNVASYS